MLGISSALWRAGYNVLMFDYTGYGDEPGPVTLGYWEMADARAALRYLRSRFPDAPLGVLGFSMGAAVAIMVAAREPDVRAVFADSPFTDQREIVRYQVGRKFRLSASQQGEWLARVVLSLVDRRLARLFGFRLSDVDPLRDVASLAPRPLALLHGEADTTIPVEHTRRMEAAARRRGPGGGTVHPGGRPLPGLLLRPRRLLRPRHPVLRQPRRRPCRDAGERPERPERQPESGPRNHRATAGGALVGPQHDCQTGLPVGAGHGRLPPLLHRPHEVLQQQGARVAQGGQGDVLPLAGNQRRDVFGSALPFPSRRRRLLHVRPERAPGEAGSCPLVP